MEKDQNQNNISEREPAVQPAEEEMSVIGRRLAAQKSAEVEEEKPEAPSLTEASPTLRWLDNFWYHYKWPTIFIAFFLVLGIICVVQLVNRPSYDSSVAIASPYLMSKTERSDLEQLFNSICPQDFNNDGKKTINITDYQIYVTEDEIESDVEAYTQMGDKFQLNQDANLKRTENFYSYIKTGETSICIVSEEMYTKLRSSTTVAVIQPLSEIYGNESLPEGALKDGHGVRLCETDFYNYHTAAQCIPDDAIICVLKPVVIGKNRSEEMYARDIAFFRAIVDFEVIEETT